MYRLIAYLGVLGCIVLGGLLGLFISFFVLAILYGHIHPVHLLIGITLGAFVGGALAVIHVRPYLRKLREKKLAKYLTSIPENAGNLIKAIIEQMQYRKKVRADVMAELIAHFEDALRECATDEEKQQKAGELIEQFGDAKLLGVLLRRAKKRCRPLWRTVIARGFQTVGVLILCLVVYLAWFLTGKPNITVDYVAELNKIVRPVADDSLNAAPLYEKAVELYGKPPKNVIELLRKEYHDTNDTEKQFMQKWLTENEEVFELLIASTQKPYYWQKYKGEESEGVISVLMPHLAGFRRLAYALRWRAQLQAEQGRYEDAFSDMKVCYRLGQHLRGDKFLIEQLVGIATEALAVRTVRDILSEYEVDSATLAGLQKDFEELTADEDFVISLEVEKLSMYDETQRCFTDDRIAGGHLCFSRKGITRFHGIAGLSGGGLISKDPLKLPFHILFTHPNKQETREMVEHLYAFSAKIAGRTPAQIRAEGINVDEEAEKIIKGNILLEILIPAIGRVIEISYRLPTDVNATLTIIALLRYREDAGSYPEELDGLITAGYLKELPMDSFSDKPLVYRKTDDDFTLYSVGLNFEDDGGEPGRDKKGNIRNWGYDGDAVFWPIQDN